MTSVGLFLSHLLVARTAFCLGDRQTVLEGTNEMTSTEVSPDGWLRHFPPLQGSSQGDFFPWTCLESSPARQRIRATFPKG